MSDLQSFSSQELEQELKRRKKEYWEKERNDRRWLADFVKANAREFARFFKMGGCRNPDDAVEALTSDDLDYVPVAYASKSPLPDGVRGN